MNFRECTSRTSLPSANKAAHSGFESQRRHQQKSETGSISDPTKRTDVPQKLKKKIPLCIPGIHALVVGGGSVVGVVRMLHVLFVSGDGGKLHVAQVAGHGSGDECHADTVLHVLLHVVQTSEIPKQNVTFNFNFKNLNVQFNFNC